MAPKEKQTTSRGKKENVPKPLWNQEKLLTKEHADYYHKIMGLKSVIPKVKFDLKEDEYPEIQELKCQKLSLEGPDTPQVEGAPIIFQTKGC